MFLPVNGSATKRKSALKHSALRAGPWCCVKAPELPVLESFREEHFCSDRMNNSNNQRVRDVFFVFVCQERRYFTFLPKRENARGARDRLCHRQITQTANLQTSLWTSLNPDFKVTFPSIWFRSRLNLAFGEEKKSISYLVTRVLLQSSFFFSVVKRLTAQIRRRHVCHDD